MIFINHVEFAWKLIYITRTLIGWGVVEKGGEI